LSSWVDSINKDRRQNWETAKQAQLWGTRSSRGGQARAGDDLFLWAGERGWQARCRVMSDARRPTSAADQPWTDADYLWVMDIEVVEDFPEPVWMSGADVKRLFERNSTAPLGQFFKLPDLAVRELQTILPGHSAIEKALADLLSATETEPPAGSDQRDYAQRVIAIRRGQQGFRQRLLEAFDGSCCISGSRVEVVLEAAHIRPYRGVSSHTAGNGLLLRADLHSLFDLGLLTVMPFGSVRVAPQLHGSEYEQFDERQILRPTDPSHKPDATALREHNARCTWLR
jgi:putative restriction endonuclease